MSQTLASTKCASSASGFGLHRMGMPLFSPLQCVFSVATHMQVEGAHTTLQSTDLTHSQATLEHDPHTAAMHDTVMHTCANTLEESLADSQYANHPRSGCHCRAPATHQTTVQSTCLSTLVHLTRRHLKLRTCHVFIDELYYLVAMYFQAVWHGLCEAGARTVA
jgi:hypothetical protein